MNIDHSFELGHSYQNSMQGYHYCGPPPNNESYRLPVDQPSELPTPVRGLGAEFGMNANTSIQEICNTINPHVFHMTCLQGLGIDSPGSPFREMFPGMAASNSATDNDETFDWMTHGFGNQMSFAQAMRM